MNDLLLVTKRCTRCEQVKPLAEFHRNRNMADGHLSRCKDCNNAAVRSYQESQKAQDPEGWRRSRVRAMDRHRSTPEGREKALAHARRRTLALRQLVENHRAEYEHILRVLKHGEPS